MSVLLSAAAALALSGAPSWPQFRGPNCQGIAENERPPVQFGMETNLVWKVAMPGGVSSPCIWGDRVFITAFESNKLLTLGLDRHTGRVLWRQAAPAEKVEETHSQSSPASATPATDGTAVYVYFGSYGLLAYDFNGLEQWRKPLPVGLVINGSGTSPVLVNGRLIVNCDQQDEKSFLLAVDPKSGKTIWETPRPGFVSSYTSPVLWGDDVVVSGSLRVVGYGYRDGKERWSSGGLEGVSVCPTPVIGEGQLFVMSRSFGGAKLPIFSEILAQGNKDGDNRMSRDEAPPYLRGHGGFNATDLNKDGSITEDEWNQMTSLIARGEHGIFALRSGGAGDVTGTHVVWKNKRGVASVSSPLYYRGRLYTIQDGGRLTAFSPKTGDSLFEQERIGVDGEYFASPIAANGHIYLCSTRGIVTVIGAADTLDVKARNKLGERIQATPAIADNKLYVRTASHLMAFGAR